MKVLFIFQFLFFIHCSSGVFIKEKPGTLEYWKISEKALLDFYGSEEQRDDAFKALTKRCNTNDSEQALTCYNLSVLFFYSGEFEKSFEFAKKSVLKNPHDELYLDMMRQAALESEKFEELKNGFPTDGDLAASFAKLSSSCRKKDEKAAFIELEFLISKDMITRDILYSGEIEECFSKELLKRVAHNVKNAKFNYKKIFIEEKKESHEFNPIWDTTNFIEKKKTDSTEIPKKIVTRYWMDFKKNIISNDSQKAGENLKNFFNEIKNGLDHDKKNKHLYNSLNKAARLLIEQDKFFEKFKFYLKEL